MTIQDRHWFATRAEVTMLTIAVAVLLKTHPDRRRLLALIDASARQLIEELVAHPTPDANIDALRRARTLFADQVGTLD